jgi:TolB-like protein/Tfp pilus assembly protein PilF
LSAQDKSPVPEQTSSLWEKLRRRGVIRVAISYAVIAWLLLQIGDVVLEPLDAPGWVMKALIVVVFTGFPVSLLLAWFFELGPTGISVDHLPESAERPHIPGIRRYVDVAIIGVLLITIVILLARQGGLLEEGQGPRVIGVLPFTEQGVAAEEAYFGAGLADTLAYKLGQLRQILVLAPSSTREFAGAGQDLAKIGALLGASALLEGTVRRAAGTLKVNARLVDIRSGQQLWSGSYDRAGADLFAVHDEIATAVTEALHLVLSPEDEGRVTQTLTESLSAYDAYLLGHSRLATRDRYSGAMLEAVDYFRRAVKIDPDYALAHAGLAEALYLSSSYSQGPVEWATDRAEAQAAAAQAQVLDPSGGEGYLAQAFIAMADNNFGDGTGWPREYVASLLRKAVELSPNNATALKFYSGYIDDSDEGLALLQRAAQLDPRSAIIRHNVAEVLEARGRFDEAFRWYLEAATLVDPYFPMAYRSIVNMYKLAGAFDVAARWARAYYQAHADPTAYWTYVEALESLAAWDEYRDVLASVTATAADAGDDVWRVANLRANIGLGVATRDYRRVQEAIKRFGGPVPADGEPWPDVRTFRFGEPMLLAAALCEWLEGRPESALSMLQSGLPSWNTLLPNGPSSWEFRAPVLASALLKATGRKEEASRILAALLEEAQGMPIGGPDGIGFGRYFALAVAGETEAALDELALAIDSGWTNLWWTLDLLDADPEFAAVTAHPRFKEITGPLHRNIDAMRESFLANPELPEGYSIK